MCGSVKISMFVGWNCELFLLAADWMMIFVWFGSRSVVQFVQELLSSGSPVFSYTLKLCALAMLSTKVQLSVQI